MVSRSVKAMTGACAVVLPDRPARVGYSVLTTTKSRSRFTDVNLVCTQCARPRPMMVDCVSRRRYYVWDRYVSNVDVFVVVVIAGVIVVVDVVDMTMCRSRLGR